MINTRTLPRQNPIYGNCGLQHTKKQCPAYGKQCCKCGKLNRLKQWCRIEKKVNIVTQNDEDELYVGAPTKVQTKANSNESFVPLEVQGTIVRFNVDTGPQANIMPVDKCSLLTPKPYIKKTITRLINYTGEDLPVCGHCILQCQDKELEFFIVDTQQEPVLGF